MRTFPLLLFLYFRPVWRALSRGSLRCGDGASAGNDRDNPLARDSRLSTCGRTGFGGRRSEQDDCERGPRRRGPLQLSRLMAGRNRRLQSHRALPPKSGCTAGSPRAGFRGPRAACSHLAWRLELRGFRTLRPPTRRTGPVRPPRLQHSFPCASRVPGMSCAIVHHSKSAIFFFHIYTHNVDFKTPSNIVRYFNQLF